MGVAGRCGTSPAATAIAIRIVLIRPRGGIIPLLIRQHHPRDHSRSAGMQATMYGNPRLANSVSNS
jgi:hypothetical protein